MCLVKVKKKVTRKTGIGYKVFNIREGYLASEFFGDEPRPVRTWLKAIGGYSYGAGWHIFTTRAGAENWRERDRTQVTRKVKYRKAFLSGFQGNRPCIVAKEIYILSGVRKRLTPTPE
jgi:hypothetical protein